MSDTRGGLGVQIPLLLDENHLVSVGIQIFSDDDDVLQAAGSNTILRAEGSALLSFEKTAMTLGEERGANFTSSHGETVFANETAVLGTDGASKIICYGLIDGEEDGISLFGSRNSVHNFGEIFGNR